MESIAGLDYYLGHPGEAPITYQAGETIFTEGDPADGVYFVVDHYVKILKRDRGGKDFLLSYAKAGEPIGLSPFFQEFPGFTCSVIVGAYPCRITFIAKEVLQNILRMYPSMEHNLYRLLCKRIDFIESRMNHLRCRNYKKRIVNTLALIAIQENMHKGMETAGSALIQHTTDELAALSRTSEKQFKEVLATLKEKGMVDYGKGWVLVKDLARLTGSFKNDKARNFQSIEK